jgi:hypothetical protein
MSTQAMIEFSEAVRQMACSAQRAVQGFSALADVITLHREQWLCEGEGQWPDKFTLLNRYVRTDLEPPFIINI